jgi:hypothetical protein
MRKLFRGYYQPSSEEFKNLWENGSIVLDTNVILNFYRYSEKTSNDLFKTLRQFSDRLWIPYQVASEYQKNRLEVITSKKNAYDDICEIFDQSKNKLKSDLQRHGKHPFIEIKNIENKIESFHSNMHKQIIGYKKKHPDLIKNDSVRQKITELFDGKIGNNYSKEKLTEKYQEAKKRYDEKVPPGYLDEKDKKGNEKYGDFIVWSQIIEKAKESQKPIIFVTDETYDDWWWKWNGETLGPRPELVQEIYSETGVLFYMYRPEQFIRYAGTYLNQKVDSNTVKEIQKISEENLLESSQILHIDFIKNLFINKQFDEKFLKLLKYSTLDSSGNRYGLDLDETTLQDRLAIARQLVEPNSLNNLHYVAESLEMLANFHLRANNFTQAEQEFNEALQIYQRLAKNNPTGYTGAIKKLHTIIVMLNRLYGKFE